MLLNSFLCLHLLFVLLLVFLHCLELIYDLRLLQLHFLDHLHRVFKSLPNVAVYALHS